MSTRAAAAEISAMSTVVALTGVGVAEQTIARAAEHARQLAEAWEQRFSRFRPSSLLCRLNAANGRPVTADETFRALLERAALAVARTGGRFDPAILPALEALGYDRTIDLVRAAPQATSLAPVLPRCSGVGSWAEVRVDHDGGAVTLPSGMRIDFGGIAKGAFVDLLAAEFAHWPGGCIDAGGDAIIWGEAPDGRAWHVGVENALAPDQDALALDVPAGSRVGVATSGTHRRSWQFGGHAAHHLIDPRTGNPAQTGVRSVTALAATVTVAEVAAKAVLLAAAAPPVTDLFDASAVLLLAEDGRMELLHASRGIDDDIEYHPAA